MSEGTGFPRWAQLMDRKARDEALTSEEQSFCEYFAEGHEVCQVELGFYEQLAELDSVPNDDSRALVDSALRRLEAEDAEQAVAEVRLLRPSRLPMWLLVSAASAAALLLGLSLRDRPPAALATSVQGSNAARPLTRAELVYASGDVRVGAQRAVTGRTLLSEGALIETHDGIACVLIDSDINVCLDANSGMRLTAIHAPARRVELVSGVLATRLATQPEGMSLTITAGDVSSTAIGTAFAVERKDGAPVVTTVLNGKVRVARDNVVQMVNAHERATSDANQLHWSAVSRSEEAVSWALLGPTMLWHDPVSATLELVGNAEGAEAWLDGQPIGRAPLWSLVPVGGHHLVVRNQDGVLLDQKLHWNAGESRTVRYEVNAPAPSADLRPAPADKRAKPRHRAKQAAVKQTVTELALNAKVDTKVVAEPAAPTASFTPPVASAAELLRGARKLVREGRMQAAADAYELLRRSHPQSEEAHTVLVSLGQLQLSALHDPKHALELLDAYLARGGTLSEEARITRIRALRALGRAQDEAVAIGQFLNEHPRSFNAPAMRERLTHLQAAE